MSLAEESFDVNGKSLLGKDDEPELINDRVSS